MTGKSEGGGNAPLHIPAGVIGGSTGGASQSDLARGFTRPDERSDGPATESGIALGPEPEPNHGFLDRPHGWER